MKPSTDDSTKQLHLKIGGMQCSFCVESIRKAFLRMDGVMDIGVSLAHEEALIQYNPAIIQPRNLRETLTSLGYTVRDPDKLISLQQEQEELKKSKKELVYSSSIALLAFILMVLKWLKLYQPWFPHAMLGLTLLNIFIIGWPILKMAFASVRRGILNQHSLMELGALGGLIGGIIGFFVQPWPMADFFGAAIFITTYHILSGTVSLIVRTKSSQAINKLMGLQPETARVIRDGTETDINIDDVQLGDMVVIRPGESIPVDGVVSKGESSVNQSLVTGESIPVLKKVGDEVIGGSINQFGTLIVEVTKIGEESFLHKVALAIQEARALKPSILMVVEKILKYFAPGVVLAAVTTLVLWTIGAWVLTGQPNIQQAIFSTLAVLVMGYPCALGMATPLAMIRGGGIAAEKGILMRSGEAFQLFKDVDTMVFDKTGTITEGKPLVVEVISLGSSDTSELLRKTSAIENYSEHPLAQSIVQYAKETSHFDNTITVKGFKAKSGFGVRATVSNEEYVIGSPRFLQEEDVDMSNARVKLVEMQDSGLSVVTIAKNKELVGLIGITDPPKKDAMKMVTHLRSIGLEPIMVTGDNYQTANAIAKNIGINKVKAEVLPVEKATYIRELQQQGHVVAMVGDGINDAPALVQADVGIAIGAGSDIAIESADIILISSSLEPTIVDSYNISRNSYKKTKQNVFLAFAFNGIGIPLAIIGLLHPVMAMVAMVTSVSTILVNSFAGQMTRKLKSINVDKKDNIDTKTISYIIPSLHCENCINNLTSSLKKNNRIKSLKGDLKTKKVIITYNPHEVSPKTIKNLILATGHQVKE